MFHPGVLCRPRCCRDLNQNPLHPGISYLYRWSCWNTRFCCVEITRSLISQSTTELTCPHRPGRADSHKPACAQQKRVHSSVNGARKLGRICTSGCFVPQRRDSAQESKTNALDSGFFRTSAIYSTFPVPRFCHLQWDRAQLFLSPMHGRCSGQCR